MSEIVYNELVSIIMPCYNAEKYIEISISSALKQTYKNFELIIINDASQDHSLEIIESFHDHRIRVINSTKNEGVALSRNKGISIANGKYISFLDSDDIWDEMKLEKQINQLHQGYSVVCSNYYIFSENKDKPKKVRISPILITFNDMLKSNFIGNLTGIYNIEKIGKVYQKNIGHEDYYMWLEILMRSNNAYCIQQPLAKYRVMPSSLSGNKFIAIWWQWKIYRDELKLSIIRSSYYFLHYIINALAKR